MKKRCAFHTCDRKRCDVVCDFLTISKRQTLQFAELNFLRLANFRSRFFGALGSCSRLPPPRAKSCTAHDWKQDRPKLCVYFFSFFNFFSLATFWQSSFSKNYFFAKIIKIVTLRFFIEIELIKTNLFFCWFCFRVVVAAGPWGRPCIASAPSLSSLKLGTHF